ncbi:MAG: hypothetical protein COA36_13000, partial [Desulfotalea sp.]
MSQIEHLLKGFDAFQAQKFGQKLGPEFKPNALVIQCTSIEQDASTIFHANTQTLLNEKLTAAFVGPYDPLKADSEFNKSLT